MYDYIHSVTVLMVALLHLKNEFDKYKSNKTIEKLRSDIEKIEMRLFMMEVKREPILFHGERTNK